MNGHVGSARSRNRFLLLGLVSLTACAQEGSTEPAAARSELAVSGDGAVEDDAEGTAADCPRGTRIIEGTPGNDTLHGTSGRDCILGHAGNDIIRGYGGDDVVYGGAGNDRIYTGRGNSLVHAGSGDDFVDTSFSLVSIVFGEAGQDTLVGGWGFDKLFGGDGNDRISGGGGPDFLSGGACHDYLVGAGSFDVSTGGEDFDACETELSSECERGRRSRALCDDAQVCTDGERCAAGSGICVPNDAAPCGEDSGGCIPTGDIDSSCDGVDDDCDGAIDDDFASEATSCGIGECGSTGETSCVSGEVIDSCSPDSPAPNTDSVCNGVDDDCDGEIDEGFVPTGTSCGTGVCAAMGERICRDGAIIDTCDPGAGSAPDDSICNGVDDDCDAEIDEDFTPVQTTCGEGVCAATGVTACSNGILSNSCEPAPPLSQTDTTCDAIDDNCDGAADEGYVPIPTTCGHGPCTASGATVCDSGDEVDSCVVECEGNCADGLEDDNDGLVDCEDPDCDENEAWPQCQTGHIGSQCQSDADCIEPDSRCDIVFPGGYCYKVCGDGCPTGTECWAGAACVQGCIGPDADSCARPEHECRSLEAGGVTTPFCRPTCELSCPTDTVCSVDWQCVPAP